MVYSQHSRVEVEAVVSMGGSGEVLVEKHDIALRGFKVYNILISPDVIRCVVDLQKLVTV